MKARYLVLVAFVIAVPLPTFAQTKGDTLVVMKESELKEGDTVVGRVRPGTHVKVIDVKGDQILVSSGASGWMPTNQAAPFARAVEVFNGIIKLYPEDSPAYVARGVAMQDKGDHDAAIADFTEGLKRDSKQPDVYLKRGNCWSAKKDFDKAIADFSDAIRLAPDAVAPLCMRGDCLSATKKYDKAIADFTEAHRLSPNFDYPLNQLAWLMATCPNARFRNGKKAVEYGTKLCELTKWQDFGSLDTISAAYAEAGDFKNAVKWQTKAISLAPENEKADLQAHLELYKSNKPFRGNE